MLKKTFREPTQMELAIRDRKFREQRLARESKQTEADLTAAKAGRIIIKIPSFDCDERFDYGYIDRAENEWRHRCKNLIAAVKKSGQWFDWNPDWLDKGVLLMQPQTERRAA
jgi:hypothetical protein